MDEELVTGEAVAVEVRPTSFALRIAGGTIDLIALVLVTGGALLLLITVLGGIEADAATTRSSVVATLAACLVGLPTLVETVSRGRSLGRLAVGARIVRDDGGPITVRHAFLRALLGVVEVVLTFGGLATLVALFSTRSKRLGDFVAGTYSRHERFPRHVPIDFPVPPGLTAWAAIADVARLPSALSRRIAHFLRQAGGMNPQARVRLAASLAAEASRYVHPMPQAPADQVLVAIAALRREREAVALAGQDALMERLEPVLRAPRGFPERG